MEGMLSELDNILTMIDDMGFFDRPRYDVFHVLIDQAAEELGFTLHEPFDWQKNARNMRKAQFVGELGESNLASMRMEEEEEESKSVDTHLWTLKLNINLKHLLIMLIVVILQ
ncbi:hypothetical protein OESDEN_10983 [Oesophagostomum dentatum]|uniref:Uncharacterized protein n=1 Tax=Oesophagostomum dentatum TaxID=61180 RepID=A0A0B1SW74_OESDE|nr:hypothetical protein OESDEN_10983 [Oesophagostomum dentatum]